jgi:hypothetical protein
LRYALRNMASHKTSSALVVFSLALGIGANTAIFSFMDSILLPSLPVDHPERLAILRFWTIENELHGMNRHDDSFLPAKTGYSFFRTVVRQNSSQMRFQAFYGFSSDNVIDVTQLG